MDTVSVFNHNAEDYDRWFDENPAIYQAELEAVRRFVPLGSRGLEIGVGTGRFAAPLGVRFGIDPAERPARIAARRGVEVCVACGEALPFGAGLFDNAVLVTVDPFVHDLAQVLHEARRVLRPGGRLVVATLDRDSPLGQAYQAGKDADRFYRVARFHSAGEIVAAVKAAGFGVTAACQTILGTPTQSFDTRQVEVAFPPDAFEVHDGCGRGAFVVVSAEKLVG